ncbi:MAG: phytoene dehydrogenase-like protein [Gammaproteobacteria bacterium]|jgi:phytoene dehydrogenase-like protein
MSYDYDVVIAGGGHNALACAALLCKAGLKTLVAERNAWVGGGVITSADATLPGFKHDLFGSSHVWIHANPDFKKMEPELEKFGLKYLYTDNHITGHPNKDGPGIIVNKDVELTCDSIAEYSQKDAQRYREIYDGFIEIKDGFIKAMFSPPAPPSYMPSAMERSPEGLNMLRNYNLSARAFVHENFENPHVQSFILGWAMAPQITPEQEAVGQTFYIMIPGIHVYGQSIPEGGSQMLPEALAGYVESMGGKVMTNASVSKFIIHNGEARGIRLEDGTEITAGKAVVTALDPQQSFIKLIDDGILDNNFLSQIKAFSFGNIGVYRVHCALNEAPRYLNGETMSKTYFQRIFYSVQDTQQHYADIAMGIAPRNPFLWIACWTLLDPTRAPEGKHTLIIDTFVPSKLSGGQSWEDIKENYADVVLKKLREYTSNMGDENILAYYIDTPETIERRNICLIGGSTTGGDRTLAQSGYFRPVPGYSDYRSPVKNLYMTGPSCHPGGGISAMGTLTAKTMLQDFGMLDEDDEL